MESSEETLCLCKWVGCLRGQRETSSQQSISYQPCSFSKIRWTWLRLSVFNDLMEGKFLLNHNLSWFVRRNGLIMGGLVGFI